MSWLVQMVFVGLLMLFAYAFAGGFEKRWDGRLLVSVNGGKDLRPVDRGSCLILGPRDTIDAFVLCEAISGRLPRLEGIFLESDLVGYESQPITVSRFHPHGTEYVLASPIDPSRYPGGVIFSVSVDDPDTGCAIRFTVGWSTVEVSVRA